MILFRDDNGRIIGDPAFVDSEVQCFSCGERPDAMWAAVGHDVYVCQACATDVLPKLIADAVGSRMQYAGRVRRIDAFERALGRVQIHYWHAAACAGDCKPPSELDPSAG